MYAWQFAKALYTAGLHGWTRFVSMQNHYNLENYASDGTGTLRRRFLKVPVPSDA
jgi:hypothetical protein